MCLLFSFIFCFPFFTFFFFFLFFFFFQAEDGIRDWSVTGVPDVCSSDLAGTVARSNCRCQFGPAADAPGGTGAGSAADGATAARFGRVAGEPARRQAALAEGHQDRKSVV